MEKGQYDGVVCEFWVALALLRQPGWLRCLTVKNFILGTHLRAEDLASRYQH